MSMDSRSRSRSPIGDEDGDGSPRSRRNNRWKFERPSKNSSNRGSSNNRVYVSNIPFEYKWQEMKDLFRTQVGDVAFVEMFEDDNRKPRGSALVEFDSYDLAQKAIDKMHHFGVKGRKLVVKEKNDAMRSREFQFLFNPNNDRDRGRAHRDQDRRPKYDRPSFRDRLGNDDPNVYGNTYGLSIPFLKSLNITGPLVNKIFVANLDYKVTGSEVAEVFRVAGSVVNTEILKDPDGKSRGFAVVEFEHPVQAVQAISMLHNQTYYDRVINVRLDRVAEKQQKTGGGAPNLPKGLKSLGMGLGANGTAITEIPTFTNQTQSNSNPGFGGNNMGGPMGGGSGSGFDMGGNSNNSNMQPNMNPIAMLGLGGGGGGGGIDQLSAISNTLGMNMGGNPPLGPNMGMGGNLPMGNHMGNNLPMGNQMGGNLPMGNQMGNNNNNIPMNQMGNMGGLPQNPNMMGGGGSSNMGGGGGGSNMGNFGSYGGGPGGGSQNGNGMYSGSPNNERRGSASYSSASSSRTIVQVANLPSDYTWQSLKDLCRSYGDIKFAEIRSKGTGLVRFSSETEARRAADVLDRQRFDGRLIDAHVL